MKPAKHIERLIRKMAVEPSAETHERTLADLVTSHVKQTRGAPRAATWIASRTVGTAVAAGLVLLALVGAIALHESATPVYAVEQTVAAIKRIPVVHILGQDWDDKRIEMWIKVNPDTGLIDSCHVRYVDDDRFMVSTPKNTYDYDGKVNTVRIKDGPSVASILCLGDFFHDMEQLAKTLDGQITHCEVTDTATKRHMLELKLSAPQTEIICLIDPKSKLPISINVTRGGRFGSCDILKHATEIRYRDPPPEGLFDFTIPGGASVSLETLEDPLQSLPASVLRYCGEFHTRTVQDLAQPQGIPVNTRMFFVDGAFILRSGGFVGIYNDSNEVWKDEIGVFNVDPPHLALFDAATGKKQKIRLVQHRLSPPGRVRVYWQFEEPLLPGETRYGISWMGDAKKLESPWGDGSHPLVMNNRFGHEGIENFMLIVPKEMDVRGYSKAYDSVVDVDDYRVYAWQRRLPAQMIVNQIEVSLTRAPAG